MLVTANILRNMFTITNNLTILIHQAYYRYR